MRRVMRSPRHEFYVRTFPWCLQPVAIAPVLPGDTLKNARIEYRAVTDPLDSKLLGWWNEMHVFYVKHRDIDAYNGNTSYQDMVLQPNPTTTLASVSGGGYATYRINGRHDHVQECLNTVTAWFFRNEGEAPNAFTEAFTGLPLQRLGRNDWMDSLVETSVVGDVDLDVDLDGNDTVMASEVDAAMRQYMTLLQQGALVDMTYEDFLATYGVNPGRQPINRPELLRSIRQWTQPSNTVTQGTGAVTSACVWSVSEAISKKDYFFKEPGFIFALTVSRPKVYRNRQTGAAVNMLDTAYSWLPSALAADQTVSLVALDTVSGAIPSVTASGGLFTADMRDLFVHGDQFLMAAPSVAGADSVAAGGVWGANLPAAQTSRMATLSSPIAASGRPDYPAGTATERAIYFAGSTAETQCIEIEGFISLQIAGTTVDMTPGQPVRS